MAAPLAPSGTNAVTASLEMADWPSDSWPAYWNPTNSSNTPHGVAPYSNRIKTGTVAELYRIRIGGAPRKPRTLRISSTSSSEAPTFTWTPRTKKGPLASL